jgi:ribosomal subunit interface protein
MRVDTSFKYLEQSEFINNVLENNFRKVKRRIQIFRHNQPVRMSVHIEKNPHREQFFCHLHLYLPTSKVLVADEKSASSSLAINKAFSALTRQLDKEKHKWQKQQRRARQSRATGLK